MTRFLVDAQLPPALARWLEAQGHMAEHVFEFGGDGTTDGEIWMRALSTGAIIVSKDEDFPLRAIRDVNGPLARAGHQQSGQRQGARDDRRPRLPCRRDTGHQSPKRKQRAAPFKTSALESARRAGIAGVFAGPPDLAANRKKYLKEKLRGKAGTAR